MTTPTRNLRNFGHKFGEKTVIYTLFFRFLILSETLYTGRLNGRQDACCAASPSHPIRGPPMT
ncbi:UNVERIFIED_CONTAM: hypothetical protein JM85_2457 [Acetobacter peroxydans]